MSLRVAPVNSSRRYGCAIQIDPLEARRKPTFQVGEHAEMLRSACIGRNGRYLRLGAGVLQRGRSVRAAKAHFVSIQTASTAIRLSQSSLRSTADPSCGVD